MTKPLHSMDSMDSMDNFKELEMSESVQLLWSYNVHKNLGAHQECPADPDRPNTRCTSRDQHGAIEHQMEPLNLAVVGLQIVQKCVCPTGTVIR